MSSSSKSTEGNEGSQSISSKSSPNAKNATSSSNESSCKMFVGGLNWKTTPESLQEYFCSYGKILDCSIVRDPVTKKSRCYGFITYEKPEHLEKAVAAGPHRVDDKQIDAKYAAAKNSNSEFGQQSVESKPASRTRKIFVGGLSSQTTLDDIKAYFNQYGQIENAMLMIDKYTQRHRGFAFVTFESELVVERVCEIHFHEINNKMVECKPAQPREELAPTNSSHNYGANGYASASLAPAYSLPGYPAFITADMLGYAPQYAAMYYPRLDANILSAMMASLRTDSGTGAQGSMLPYPAGYIDPSQPLALGLPGTAAGTSYPSYQPLAAAGLAGANGSLQYSNGPAANSNSLYDAAAAAAAGGLPSHQNYIVPSNGLTKYA